MCEWDHQETTKEQKTKNLATYGKQQDPQRRDRFECYGRLLC
jgi:hypothetical protein